MRQIVAGLTGDSDGTGDLAVELSKTDPASLETGQDSEDDSGEPEDWVPDPVDADPGLCCQPCWALHWRVQPAGTLVSQWLPHMPWGLRGSGVRGQHHTLPLPRVLQLARVSCRVLSLWACRRAAYAPPTHWAPSPRPRGLSGWHRRRLCPHEVRWHCPLCRAGKSSSKRRSSDIISLLVSIYGSKDLFINEYRSLLADRLLHQFSFSPER